MVRVAVIGLGHWGPNLARVFHSGERSTVGHLVDVRAERVEQLAAGFPGARTGTDVDAVFGDPQVDAVVIATPAETHFALARRALEAGKHVLVEKPITRSSAEALALDELARRQRRVLLVGHVYLFHPAVQVIRRLLDEGAVGAVRSITMVRSNAGPVRRDVNAAWDLSAHDLSMAAHWLAATPESVSARGAAYLQGGVADVVSATVRFPPSTVVQLEASWLGARKVRDIRLVGERQMLCFDDLKPEQPLRRFGAGLPLDGEAVEVPRGEPLKAQAEHFLDCILDGAAPRCDGRWAASVVRTLEAVQQSLERNGAQVAV
jgi:predicted dehydrogenase